MFFVTKFSSICVSLSSSISPDRQPVSVSHVFQDSNNSLFVISWLCLYQDLLTLQTNSVSVDGKVEKGWQASWESLSFKIKIQRLENPWKLQSVLESLWISVLNLSNPDSQMPTRSKHWKTGQNCWHCKRAKKRHILKAFLTLNEVVEKWEMCPLEIPRKALEFFVQKRVRTPWIT